MIKEQMLSMFDTFIISVTGMAVVMIELSLIILLIIVLSKLVEKGIVLSERYSSRKYFLVEDRKNKMITIENEEEYDEILVALVSAVVEYDDLENKIYKGEI